MLVRDCRFAIRFLLNNVAFAAAAILSLALAIGANTAIFSAVETVLVRPLPVPDVDRIVAVGKFLTGARVHAGLQPAEVFDLETRRDLFDAVAGYRNVDANLTGSGDPQRVAVAATTAAFFDVFSVRPFLGRMYDRSVATSGATHVVVLSYDFWRQLTGGDRSAIGRGLSINDSSYTLVGVLPPGFDYPVGVQVWTPQPLDPLLDRHASADAQHAGGIVPAVARRRAGVTLQLLQSELSAAQREWTARMPQYYLNRLPGVIEARSFVTVWAGDLRSILGMLVGAAALVLLIACANIASLQLVRTTGRSREIALRAALGASRAAIARQHIIESLVLAMTGGLLGTGLGQLLVMAVVRVGADRMPELQGARLDPLVLAYSAAGTLVAAVLFGTVPALRALRVDASQVLAAAASRGRSAGRGRNRFLRTAVVAQVAVALMLLLSCGVAVRSLARLMHVDPGFEPSGIVTARLALPPSRYPVTNVAEATRMTTFKRQLLARLRQMPGIETVGEADNVPFGYRGTLDASIHGQTVMRTTGDTVGAAKVAANYWRVDGDYFRVMRIQMKRGPGFTGHEEEDFIRDYPHNGPQDVVIDEVLARRLFPNEDPIGKVMGPGTPGYRIVGVAASVKKMDLSTPAQAEGAIYYPSAETLADVTLIVRSEAPFDRTVADLREAVREVDPTLPLSDIRSMPDLISRSVGPRSLASGILSGFAVVALGLALIGIYGVLSYRTSQRTKEIGIRLALGAEPREMRRMVVASGGALTAIGLVVGAGGFLAFARVLSGVLYGVSAYDPATIAIATVTLMGSALAASLIPALRASRIDVVEALRED